MARSIKKGPYVFERLLKRVRALNESGKKEVIKTGLVVQQSILNLLVILLQYITEKNLFQFMLQKIWLDTN